MPVPDALPSSLSGFTGIELAVVVAIAALLAGLALPGFAALIERQRLRAAAEDIGHAIYLARAEALRRGGQVLLRRNDGAACAARDPADWSCGWRVAVDGGDDSAESPLQVWPAPEGVEVRMHLAQPMAALSVNRWGRFAQSQGFSVRLRTAGSSGKASAQVVCVSSGGRLRTLDRSETC